jgi:hypothetical protein
MSRLDDLKAIAARSKKPLPWYGLAMEFRGAGDVESALSTFRRCHELDPGYVAAYFMCAQLLAEQGRAGEARVEVEAGIAVARAQGDGHALSEMQGLLDSLED